MSEYIFTQMHHYFDKKIKTCEAHMKALKPRDLQMKGILKISDEISLIFLTPYSSLPKNHTNKVLMKFRDFFYPKQKKSRKSGKSR